MPFSSASVSWRVHVSTWLRFFAGNRLGPYHEMSPPIVQSVLSMAQVGPKDHFFDIGCGDGRLLIAAAQRGAKATGFEINAEVAALARANVKRAQLESRVSVVETDAKGADISDATAISLYLSEQGNGKLLPILTPHLLKHPQARVVSFLFPMPTYEPIKTELTEGSNIPCFLYSHLSIPESVRQRHTEAVAQAKASKAAAAAKENK